MKLFILFIFSLPAFLLGVEKVFYQEISPNVEPPWLTGPLIAVSAQVVPRGHVNIEPYFFVNAITGNYNGEWKTVDMPIFWNNYFQCPIYIGLTSWMDFEILPTVYWNYTQHVAHWAFGDFPVVVAIQLYSAAPSRWFPNVKLILQETLPTGIYQKLNPDDLNTTVGGGGSWNTGIGIVFGKLHHIYKLIYFNYRLVLQYALPAPVHLKGFSIYGGGYGTDARFFPNQNFKADFGMELTLTQNWAFALDVIGIWGGASHYSGFAGINADGTPAKLGSRSYVQYSLAPAIEYNWNAAIGIISGVWFTVAGKNFPIFRNGIVAINYYY